MAVQIFSGRVEAGRIVTDEDIGLADGTEVTVLTDSPEAGFETTPEEEDELLEAIAQMERGEMISAADLLERLRR